MTNKSVVDFTLEIHHQAWAVAHLLNSYEPIEEMWYATHPWYNGRECGLVFSTGQSIIKPWLYIAVFEHRNSDSICALRWKNVPIMNPPTMENSGTLAYPTDSKWGDIVHSVNYNQAYEMARWVFEQFEEFAKKGGA